MSRRVLSETAGTGQFAVLVSVKPYRLYIRSPELKVQSCLLMALRMLLSPKLKQERRHVPEDGSGSINFGVTPRTQAR